MNNTRTPKICYDTAPEYGIPKNDNFIHTKESMKYCELCGCVWEMGYHNNYGEKRLYRYEDFPTLGKPRENCPICKSN